MTVILFNLRMKYMWTLGGQGKFPQFSQVVIFLLSICNPELTFSFIYSIKTPVRAVKALCSTSPIWKGQTAYIFLFVCSLVRLLMKISTVLLRIFMIGKEKKASTLPALFLKPSHTLYTNFITLQHCTQVISLTHFWFAMIWSPRKQMKTKQKRLLTLWLAPELDLLCPSVLPWRFAAVHNRRMSSFVTGYAGWNSHCYCCSQKEETGYSCRLLLENTNITKTQTTGCTSLYN